MDIASLLLRIVICLSIVAYAAVGCIPQFSCFRDADCSAARQCRQGTCVAATPDGATQDNTAPPERQPESRPEPRQELPPDRAQPPEPTQEATPEPQPEARPEPQPDLGPPCTSGEQRPCYTATSGCTKNANDSYDCKGTCQPGKELCVNGRWSGNCGGEIPPVQELLDTKDNDCDGTVDETEKCLPTKYYFSYKHSGTLSRVRFHPFDRQLAVGTEKGVLIWELDAPAGQPKLRNVSLGTASPITGLTYITRPPIRLAYASQREKEVVLWDTEADKTTTWTTTVPIHSLDFADFSGLLYGGASDGSAWRWTLSSGQSSKLFSYKNGAGESNGIFKLRYAYSSGNPAYLLVGRVITDGKPDEKSRRLESWASSSGSWKELRKSINTDRPYAFMADFAHIPGGNRVAISFIQSRMYTPDSKQTSGYKDKILVPTSLIKDDYYAKSVAAHPKGSWVAVGMSNGDIRIVDWKPSPATLAATLKPPAKSDVIEAIDWSPHGNYLAAITKTELHLWSCP